MATFNEIRDQYLGELKAEQAKTAQTAQPAQQTKSLSFKDMSAQFLESARQQEAAPKPEAPVQPVQPRAEGFSAVDSIMRGGYNYAANVAEAVGAHDTAVALQKTAAKEYPAAQPDFASVDSLGDFANYAGERILENAPNWVAPALAGAAGGAVAGGPIGAAIGAGIATAIPMFGESRGDIRQRTGEDHPFTAIPAAAVNTALELAAPVKLLKDTGMINIFKKVAKESVKEAAVETAKKVAQSTGKQLTKKALDVAGTGLVEGGTEGAQYLTNLMTSKAINHEGWSLTPDQTKELFENTIGGLVVGTGTHVSVSGVKYIGGKLVQTGSDDQTRALAPNPEKTIANEVRDRLNKIKEIDARLAAAADQTDADLIDADNIFSGLFDVQAGHYGAHKQTGAGAPTEDAVETNSSSAVIHAMRAAGAKVHYTDVNGTEGVFDPKEEKNFSKLPTGAHASISDSDSEADKAYFKETAKHVDSILDKLGLKNKMRVIIGTEIDPMGSTIQGSNINAGVSDHYIQLNQKARHGDLTKVDIKTLEGQATKLFTINHELGHAIFYHMLQKESSLVEKKALVQAYKQFLTDMSNNNELEMMHISDGAGSIYRSIKKYGKDTSNYDLPMLSKRLGDMDPEQAAYVTSFDEFVANQFGRYMQGKTADKTFSYTAGMESIFGKALDKMRKLFRLTRKYSETKESFKDFMDKVFLQEEVRKLRQSYTAYKLDNKTASELQSDLKAMGIETKSQLVNSTSFSEQKSGIAVDELLYTNKSKLGAFLEKIGLKKQASNFRQHMDLHMGFMRLSNFLTPIQIAELAAKTGYSLPAEYMDIVRMYANTKASYQSRAQDTLVEWKALKKDGANRVSRMLFEASELSDEVNRRLSPDEIMKLRTKLQLTDEEYQTWQKIDQSFRDTLNDMEHGLIYEYARSYTEDSEKARAFREAWEAAPDEGTRMSLIEDLTGQDIIGSGLDGSAFHPLYTALQSLEKSMNQLRNKHYFPRSRLGEYYVRVVSKAKGQEWDGTVATKAGETLGFYSFDSEKDAKDFLADNLKDAKDAGVAINQNKMPSEIFAVTAMPQAMIDKLLENIELTEEQRQLVEAAKLNLSPGKRFLKHLKKRRGIAGYSEDAIRVYANYMLMAGNHLARVEHAKDLIDSVNRMNRFIKDAEANGVGKDLSDITRLSDYYNRHLQYLMKPDNDWATLRAVGFLWYLGFNVKSAAVNMTQLPLVTLPFLGAKYGNVKATNEILASMKRFVNHMRGAGSLSEEETTLLDTLREAGVIDESMATELAGLAEGGVLRRLVPGMDLQSAFNKTMYYSGAMFRMGEKFNRNVTALAAFNLARKQGYGIEAATKMSRQAIETTQFEYAKWNRPELMRGKKSVIFMFWQYLQHSAFLYFGGAGAKTALRMFVMTGLIAGLQGLPFGDTIMDMIDILGTKIKELFGSADPRVDTRTYLREMLQNIIDNPDVLMRGMSSQWGLGPLHLFGLLGAPIPNVDVQGSLSVGYMVPWVQAAMQPADNSDEKLGKIAESVLGPIAGIPIQLYKAMESDSPDTYKRVSQAMPTFIKNAMTGARWAGEGQVEYNKGGMMYDLSNTEGRVASALKMLGYTPTAVNQKYNQISAAKEATTYYALRRTLLMQDYFEAKRNGNREGMADVRQTVRDFNNATRTNPELRGMQIKQSDLNASARRRMIELRKREANKPDRKTKALETSIKSAYPVIGE